MKTVKKMGLRKKVKGLIRDDRPAKLKSFISSQDADPREIIFSRGRNVLHYCAEFGSTDMLRCLLRLECDPMHLDKDGRLPLHTALYRCLGEDVNSANQTYNGLVSLLLTVSPMSQDVEDKEGITGYDLLKKLKKKLKSAAGLQLQNGGMTARTSAEEEYDWRQKLAQETQFEWEEQQPRYNDVEEHTDKDQEEDFSSWSDRIYHEYQKKKHSQLPSHSQSHSRKRRGFTTEKDDGRKRKKSTAQADPEEELRKAREEMRKNYKPPPVENFRKELLLSKKTRYEKQFNHFFSHLPSLGTVTFGAVPWPCTNMDKLTDTLFCDLPDKESPVYRKFLRKEQVRWHPDKFSQKFRDYLHPDHVNKIMARVKSISQILNSFAA